MRAAAGVSRPNHRLSGRRRRLLPLAGACALLLAALPAAAAAARRPAAPPAAVTPAAPLADEVRLRREGRQVDFPAVAVDARGVPWVAAVVWDGAADTVVLARREGGALAEVMRLGSPGVVHQPVLAVDGPGTLWAVWSQLDERGVMNLLAQHVVEGVAAGGPVTLARSEGGNVFAHAATDRGGRVWVAWQSQRGGLPDVYCRTYDPAAGRWSAEVRVTADPAGDWEPRVVFDARADGAWVLFDSARSGGYDIYAVRVGLDGKVGDVRRLTTSERFEAHVSAAAEPGGAGIWLAFERGRAGWGLAQRGRDPGAGLNAGKDAVLARWDPATGVLEEAPSILGLLAQVPAPPPTPARPGPKRKRKLGREARAAAAEERDEGAAPAVRGGRRVRAANLPQVMLDASGRPWLAVRLYQRFAWSLFLSRYDRPSRRWTSPAKLAASVYTQDRLLRSAPGRGGELWITWPTDLRDSKKHGQAEVRLARLDAAGGAELAAPVAYRPPPPPPPLVHPVPTPERPRGARRTWTRGGVTYTLLWGDLHRHSDISRCYTESDSSIQEQYRYALDRGGLDFMGTTDHTDSQKPYHPYEWWLTQKGADIFQTPGFFAGMYAYEREHYWPNGHRNIVFADRGGPVVFRKRENYLASVWQARFPLAAGGEEVSVPELWSVLKAWGKPVTAIAHTTASGSGVNWAEAPHSDGTVENVIEIYQGARISYEGWGTPQPSAGLREGDVAPPGGTLPHAPIAGNPLHNYLEAGSYRQALAHRHRLGVFASSDHLSEHASYGGVYVRAFTRAGIVEALNARRSFGATDKIIVELEAGAGMMGQALEVRGSPRLAIAVEGTASLVRVTLVRNEADLKSWEPRAPSFRTTFADEAAAAGENRYYLRVEQADGGMAWSSPVWLTVTR